MKIKDVMKADVHWCGPRTHLDAVAMMMWNGDCGSIVVVDDNGRPVGIVTDRDIAMGTTLQHRGVWDMPVSSVTRDRPVYTCGENDDIKTVLGVMVEHRVRRVPVVNQNGELRGIVSTADIVGASGKGGRGTKREPGPSCGEVVKVLRAISQPAV